jgi:two-component system sensor histidine kinase HydH
MDPFRKVSVYLKASKKGKMGIVLGTILGITLFHYSIGVNPLSHQIYGKFYYAPIIMGALWSGVKGGLITSMIVSLLLLPHLFLNWQGNPANVWGILLEVPTLILAGLVTGYLRDRESTVWSRAKKTYSFATHEMKNIGMSIHGFVNLIKRRGNPSEEVSKFLGVIEKEARRMESVAKTMLLFSKDLPLKKEKTDMNEFLKEIASLSEEMARERGVYFRSKIKEGLPSAWMDSDRMKEALINLLQNAFHATPEGKGVILRADENGRHVKIEVLDSGKGIAAEDLPKIFLPFYTTKSEGTGLGLAITKRIIEAHGASVIVHSQEGKGTHFKVIFPVNPVRKPSTF